MYPNFPLTYFVLFRNSRNMEPPVEVWDYVRKKWPVLSEKSNEELETAMAPIRAVYIDPRSI